MSAAKYKRRLTAIFSADVVGYGRLMGEDEAATVDTITNYREIMMGGWGSDLLLTLDISAMGIETDLAFPLSIVHRYLRKVSKGQE